MRYLCFYSSLALFFFQVYLVFNGVYFFGKLWNPVVLCCVSLALPLPLLIKEIKTGADVKLWQAGNLQWLFTLLCCAAACIVAVQCYRTAWEVYKNYGEYSDVIPQLETLYRRFIRGEQPYYPLARYSWHPFPVYMPAHWLPLGIAIESGKDVRWVGLLFLIALILVFAFYLGGRNSGLLQRMVAALLMPFVLIAYCRWGDIDQMVGYDTIVAAYYLLLAYGLQARSLPVITAGIILCLLSRYTLVFWLPLFALILLAERPFKTSLLVWGSVAAAFVLAYVIPFLLKEPSVLRDGVSYHNRAAIAEWSYPVSYTFENGIYFARHMRAVFQGTMEERVFDARVVQGLTMILLNIGGWIGYRKLKGRVSSYTYLLVTLYVFLICFYMIGPLTYRYYLITPLMLSAVICLSCLPGKSPAPERIFVPRETPSSH